MKFRALYLSIVKLVLTMFIVYILFIAEIQKDNRILYGTFLLSLALIIFDMFMSQKLRFKEFIPKIDRMLILYGIYSLIAGVLVASHIQNMFSSLATYFAFTIVCIEVCYVSYRSGGIDWILPVIFIVALLAMFYATFFGYTFRTEGVSVITLSEINNPNTLGLLMILGVYSIVARKKNLSKFFLIKTTIVIWMLYVTILTGSRKSMICALILFLVWINTVRNITDRGTIRWYYVNTVILIIVVLSGYYMVNYFSRTSGFTKIFNTINYGYGVSSRENLALKAFELWKENPIFGIGFDQFATVSGFGIYSHSVYTEVLSCSGIIGTLVFFIPVISLSIRMIKRQMVVKKDYDSILQLCMLFIELLIGVGNIYIYKFSHLLILTYLSFKLEFDVQYPQYITDDSRGII